MTPLLRSHHHVITQVLSSHHYVIKQILSGRYCVIVVPHISDSIYYDELVAN